MTDTTNNADATDTTDTEIDAINEINTLLERNRLVAVVWMTEDVLDLRGDLTDDQAWEVLQECRRRHDCYVGFNWEYIESVAEDLYGRPKDEDEDEDED